ncbi:MAG TPA: ABC transporter permease, partial [Chitinophagaceae bacterium]
VERSLPAVEYAAAVAPAGWFPQNTLSAGDKDIKANGQYAEKDYFHIFSFKILDGDDNRLLESNSSIVISDELATKLFGTTHHLIGKTVTFDHDTTFFVSGVFQKMPANSSQQFDFVLSFDYFRTVKKWVTDWYSTGPLNYIRVKKGTSLANLNTQLFGIIRRNTEDTSRHAFAMKFSDVYLHNNYNGNVSSGARIGYVNLFSALAAFILIIACINFMNLSTAKAARRFKEVGIKKVVGADRKQLIVQFLSESSLLTAIAMAFAILFAGLLLPVFNQVTGKHMVLHFTPQILIGVMVITTITGLISGSYPALYLSKFQPLAILKGKMNTSVAELLSRKGLVVFQFALSTMLIVAVMVVYQQIQFIQHADPGYNKSNVLRLSAEGTLASNQETFVTELKRIPGIRNVSVTEHRMVGHNFATDGVNWPGKDPNMDVAFEAFGVGYDFIETMGMHVKEGRSFSRNFKTDTAHVMINETAARVMNLKDPAGKTITVFNHPSQVIGVVKDFHFESMHDAIKPAYLFLTPHAGTIVVSLQPNLQNETIGAIEKLYTSFNPGFPFTYNFVDEAYQQQYVSETRVSILSKYFAALAIIISCLGLFGLAAFTAQQRRKEIGIRKVIGASVTSVTTLLSKDFLKLIALALVISFPVSWWLMSTWLNGFAYRVSLRPSVFLITGLAVLLITIFTISFQAIKAAVANPIRSLRTE